MKKMKEEMSIFDKKMKHFRKEKKITFLFHVADDIIFKPEDAGQQKERLYGS